MHYVLFLERLYFLLCVLFFNKVGPHHSFVLERDTLHLFSSLFFLLFIFESVFQISWLVLEIEEFLRVFRDANGSLLGLWHRLLHVMLDVAFIICLVYIVVSWLVSNMRVSIVPFKVSCIVFSIGSICIVVYILLQMFYLGWLGACLHHVLTIPQSFMPLWSFSFWLVMPLYALINMFCRYAWLWPLCSLSWSHPVFC